MTHPYIPPSTDSVEYVLEPLAFKRGCDVKPDLMGSYRAGAATTVEQPAW
jgi:hypothetical protein